LRKGGKRKESLNISDMKKRGKESGSSENQSFRGKRRREQRSLIVLEGEGKEIKVLRAFYPLRGEQPGGGERGRLE